MLTAVQSLVARLRSGHVKQIRGRLADQFGGRCCLGVACDIGVEYGVIAPPQRVAFNTGLLAYGKNCDAGTLPEEVQAFFGFSSRAGAYTDAAGIERALLEDNDGRGLTFPQIADIIESRPKGLFKKDVAANLLPPESLL